MVCSMSISYQSKSFSLLYSANWVQWEADILDCKYIVCLSVTMDRGLLFCGVRVARLCFSKLALMGCCSHPFEATDNFILYFILVFTIEVRRAYT